MSPSVMPYEGSAEAATCAAMSGTVSLLKRAMLVVFWHWGSATQKRLNSFSAPPASGVSVKS